jgi:hypothetical protein
VLLPYLAGAAARRTGDGAGALFRAAAAARFAGDIFVDPNLARDAKGRLFECDAQFHAQISTAHRAVSPCGRPAAAEEGLKYVAEAKAAHIEAAEAAAGAAAVKSRMSKHIILPAFILVA